MSVPDLAGCSNIWFESTPGRQEIRWGGDPA
jgi:hypothetical protein